MKVLLISTYELGHQPFGLASPAAWLKNAGHQVKCLDLAIQSLDPNWVQSAELIAFYVPMHTATRLAIDHLAQIRQWNPTAHICFYGLYASMNESYLRQLGVDSIIGGEFEEPLVKLCQQLQNGHSNFRQGDSFPSIVSLSKQKFLVPERSGLPHLSEYAQLTDGKTFKHIAGYVETSRGCKYHCSHCPIVPIYKGRFRIVQKEVVLADIRQQIEQGARHITFGDPDFFNGTGHTIPIVEELHRQFPNVTYDVTIKIEHLLKFQHYLPVLKQTGCLFITSAVEAFDDHILNILQKGHARDDIWQANELCRKNNLHLNPTFVAFTPWTSLKVYQDFLSQLIELNWVDVVHPIQFGIRLLVPEGSLLLNSPEMQPYLGNFDEENLTYRWFHPDPRMDELQKDVMEIIAAAANPILHRHEIFQAIWRRVAELSPEPFPFPESIQLPSRATVPYLNEPWYC